MEESRTKEGQMCAYQHQLTHHFLLLTAEHTIQFRLSPLLLLLIR